MALNKFVVVKVTGGKITLMTVVYAGIIGFVIAVLMLSFVKTE